MNDREPEEISSSREINASNTAFFFDLDGTLAEIVEDPAQVRVEAAILNALDNLYRGSNGALAVISGRPVAILDRLLSPLRLPLSGVHGLERRDGGGTVHRASYDDGLLERLHRAVAQFAAGHGGLIVEEKPGSVALHYRQRPELRDRCLALARELQAMGEDIALMHGKMVVELRLGGRSKADAVAEFMAAAPFVGRSPLFAGDDVTDEDAFRLVAQMGGVGIKIGDGQTAASLRMPDRQAFEAWLCQLGASPNAEAEVHSGGKVHSAAPRLAAANSGA